MKAPERFPDNEITRAWLEQGTDPVIFTGQLTIGDQPLSDRDDADQEGEHA